MLVEFLPRGCVPARRGTCVLNCQGVIMPWLLHLCLSQVYYQTKYRGVHGYGLQIHAAILQPDGQLSITVLTLHTGQEKTLEFYTQYVFMFLSWKKTKWC